MTSGSLDCVKFMGLLLLDCLSPLRFIVFLFHGLLLVFAARYHPYAHFVAALPLP